MNILVTGSAGFIGYHVCDILLKRKSIKVFGIDNYNNYYSVLLKKKRTLELKKKSSKYKNFFFYEKDITKDNLNKLFKKKNITHILHFAAQAGVRYSIKNPETYINNNIIGTFKVLELSKILKIKHLIIASTSSVYGNSLKNSLAESDDTNRPIQLYAASKKSTEVIAHSYSSMFNIPITILRFFTVFGPWGRPDMALYKFVDGIIRNKKIDIYNNGNHKRSFSYITDVKKYIYRLINKPFKKNIKIKYRILNVGSDKSTSLKNFIKIIEEILQIKAKKNYLPLQKGDVVKTKANIKKLKKISKKYYNTNLRISIKSFVNWYLKLNK